MNGNLAEELGKMMADVTFSKSVDVGLAKAQENHPYIKHTIAELGPSGGDRAPVAAIVMAAGPSLHRKDPAKLLKEMQFEGPLVVADSSMGYCLRNGIVPDYVVTVDPDNTRVIRWFGDPILEEREVDEYFTRQEMDPAMHQDGNSYNRQLIEMVNEFGPQIKAIISTSSSAAVRDRCRESGMELYWWNPMYDDYDSPTSYSRQVFEMNEVPCMVTGGNVGTSAWAFAAGVLEAKNVALTGMDLSYPPENPLINTQYYTELLAMFGDRMEEAFTSVYNPHLNETWYADPAYFWFRQGFLELAGLAPCKTYNCTEGGILFGDDISFIKLQQFLDQVQSGRL